jgi:hypothetical protein
MHYWMQTTAEFAVLDYILTQQDRIGNGKFRWVWAYVENGAVQFKDLKLRSNRTGKDLSRADILTLNPKPPAEIASFNPELLQTVIMGDNDAGVLVKYANYTKKFKLLEEIRHLSPLFYSRLQFLAKDLKSNGALANYVRENFTMSQKDYAGFAANVELAANILKRSCLDNQLRFDLNFQDFLISGGLPYETQTRCE